MLKVSRKAVAIGRVNPSQRANNGRAAQAFGNRNAAKDLPLTNVATAEIVLGTTTCSS
jgi:hypothetical protein